MGSPGVGGGCWIAEVNECDWLIGVFLLLLQFAHSQTFTPLFFLLILPSLASSKYDMKDGGVNKEPMSKILRFSAGSTCKFSLHALHLYTCRPFGKETRQHVPTTAMFVESVNSLDLAFY